MYKYILLFLICLNFSEIFSQETSSADSISIVSNTKPVITISKIKPGSITIDGKLNETEWSSAQIAKDFVEIEPGDNTKPPVETEVFVMYDDDNLYFGFVCHENEMKSVISSLCDRDKIFNDDWVGAIIDPYGDNRRGYELFVNPNGIQGDLMWTKQGENISYDMIFYTDASAHKDKWIVEMSVPFKSLSFPDKVGHDWKVHFLRTRPRDTRCQMSWAVISRDDPAFIEQAGIMKGIKNVKGGRNFEVLPYVIGSLTGRREDIDNPDSKFLPFEEKKGEFGVGIKYGFTSNLTGELVYNPDFSQIETDAAKVDVNSSSALFYDEKRPFFLEGSDIFDSYISVVYTRMINHPLAAVKLTGKVNGIDIGYIGAYDEKTQFIVPHDFGSDFVFSDTIRSFSNILRLRKSLKGESFLGFIATDREAEKGYNRVIGIDGSFRFWKDMYLNWEGLYYSTKEMNDPGIYSSDIRFGKNLQHTLTFDGEAFTGFGGFVEIQKRTRNYGGGLSYSDAPPEARRDLGFISSNNYRTLSTWNYYTFYPESKFFLRVEPQLNAGIRYDYNNRIREQWLFPGFWMLLKNQINMSGGYFLVNNEEFEGIYHKDINRGWININFNGNRMIRGGGYFEAGEYIARFESPSYVGRGFYAEPWLTLTPMNRLNISFNYVYTELSKKSGEKLYAGYILLNKTTFQFTKNLLMRLIVQYDSFSRSLDVDPLVSYKWTPFTVFYIGSSHDFHTYNSGNKKTRLVETGRQIFAKFQYLFRL